MSSIKVITDQDIGTGLGIHEGKLVTVEKSTEWVQLPASYNPPDFAEGSTISLRRTENTWEILINCKGVTKDASWSLGGTLPKEWLPDFDVQVVLTGNNRQMGRVWVRQSGSMVYTGTLLTGNYAPTAYLCVRTTKPFPAKLTIE